MAVLISIFHVVQGLDFGVCEPVSIGLEVRLGLGPTPPPTGSDPSFPASSLVDSPGPVDNI